jgi:arginyl-tRNA synthetase
VPADALARIEAALSAAAGQPVELERPGNAAHGDYATNVALRLAPARRLAPLAIAEELRGSAEAIPGVERAEVAAPGFLNLVLTPAWFGEALAEMVSAGRDFGGGSAAAAAERIQVELVSANPTGPLTVGSARNGAYGDSVARLLRFAGHEVEEEYYFNDAGTQMERFRESVEARRQGALPPEDGYHGGYIEELAGLPGDPVPTMLARIEESLARFRIPIDTWRKQSEIEAEVPDAIALLDTYEADGAVWARTSAYGDEKDRVLVRSNGEPTYFAADAAYIRHKLERFDRAIYVLGADHHGYVARLKALAAMAGTDPARIEVLIYQLVHLTEAGAAKKMS